MRRLPALLIAALLAVLAGCAQVPTGSDPIAVRSVNDNDIGQGPDVHSLVEGPRKGEAAYQIVAGFLDACSAAVQESRHQQARQFLTPKAANTWNDAGATTVYTQRFIRPEHGGVTVIMQRLGMVGPNGAYTVDRGTSTFRFDVRRVKGEWRINNPPAGITVKSNDFDAYFRRINVYFLGAGDVVVPEPRYFPIPYTSLANRVMQALLAGPSDWLKPAVRTDFPKGTKLRRNVIEDSPATTVDLANLGSMTSAALKGMSAQIVWTLAGLNSGTTVEIRADGQPLEIPGVDRMQHISDWEGYDPDALPVNASAYITYEGSVWALDGNRVPGPAGEGAYDLRAVAVSADRAEMAGVAEKNGRDHLYVGGFGHAMSDRIQANWLTRPTWGNRMYGVWSIRNGSDVIRIPLHGEPQVVPAPGVARIAPVTAMRLSRDGTRAALIGSGGRLYLARVSAGNGHLSIDGLREIAPELHNVTDVAWSSADTLAVLAPNSTSYPVVWDLSVDGSSRTAHSNIDNLPGQLTGIAAAPNRQTVGVAEGTLWQLIGNGWSRIIAKHETLYGENPTYPD